MQDIGYSGEATIVSKLAERLSASATVNVVYGEARQVGDKTVIPVAKVEYAFGAGAGGGTGPAIDNGKKMGSGGGGGGGGGVRVRPIGVLEVTADETRDGAGAGLDTDRYDGYRVPRGMDGSAGADEAAGIDGRGLLLAPVPAERRALAVDGGRGAIDG